MSIVSQRGALKVQVVFSLAISVDAARRLHVNINSLADRRRLDLGSNLSLSKRHGSGSRPKWWARRCTGGLDGGYANQWKSTLRRELSHPCHVEEGKLGCSGHRRSKGYSLGL